MRRRYRYGIFIASAILACAPLAMNNNVVKADAEPAQSNVKGGQQGAAGVTSDTKGDQQGKSADGVQQNGTQTDGDTNGETPAPATSKLGTSTATGEKAPQGDSTTQPVAKTDSEIPSAEVQHAGTKEDPHQITESYDNNLDPQTPIEINAIGATQNDAINYIRNNYGKNIHIHVDDKYNFRCGCGQVGCLETLCGQKGVHNLVDYYRNSLATKLEVDYTVKDVFDLARGNDPLAYKAFEVFTDKLGLALANVSALFNPSTIIIGGGISQAGDFLINHIKTNFLKYATPVVRDTKIILASLGSNAGMYGAYYLIKDLVKN